MPTSEQSQPTVPTQQFGRLSGRSRKTGRRTRGDHPLVIALHGGTYTSAYFDIPEYSLLDRAAALGIPVVAVDRPGYGASHTLPSGTETLRNSAGFLAEEIGTIWEQHKGSATGVVLIGHSIGAAIALTIAAGPLAWPLLGVAVSGVGMHTPPHSRDAWAGLPDLPIIEMPRPVKDGAMFGPPGSFSPDMPAAQYPANSPMPKTEIMEVVTTWEDGLRDEVLPRITVPVHYRQAEGDKLWIVSPQEIAAFAAALSASSFVDARMMPGTGHCIDFHRVGEALQVQQLGFALQCAAEASCG